LEVYDLSGRFWQPEGGWSVLGPGSCVLPDIDIDSDGTLIAAVGFCSDSGKGEMLRPDHDFLSFFDSTGRNIRFDFRPSAWLSIGAAFDGSHNVLLLGVTKGGKISLRRYTGNGQLLQDFPVGQDLEIPGSGASRGEHRVFVSDQRIGILIDHLTSGMEWLEISLTGQVLYRTTIKDPSLRNFVTTADGRLFAQSGARSSSRGPIVMLDRASSRWITILNEGALLGSDENQLVLNASDQSGLLRLQWVTPDAEHGPSFRLR
jgi:hypothetical protein